MFDLTYETNVGLVIVVLLTIVGCIMYTMKDRLFVKKVEFNPVVEIMDDKQDKEYIPSNSLQVENLVTSLKLMNKV